MAFLPYKYDTADAQATEYLPASAGKEFQVGQVCVIAGGMLMPVTSTHTDMPPYLSMASRKTEADGEEIAVQRIGERHIYATELSAGAPGLAIGDKLEISADGMTAEAEVEGSLEVVNFDGTAEGDTVYVRFVFVAPEPEAGA
ncbi:MAG: hypothetical protein LBT88_06610 [Oscillospiraceae bacterium]|jgi:hypothetical protein|nr:hypothetical protein [Oscillospiraceae bacterium]